MDGLIDDCVYFGSQATRIHGWQLSFASYELGCGQITPLDRTQLCDRNTMRGHRERFSRLNAGENLAAVIAEISHRDRRAHVSHGITRSLEPSSRCRQLY